MNDRFNLNLFREVSTLARPLRAKEITEEVYHAENLSISILPIDLPGTTLSYRKELESTWLKLLPDLHKVKSLSIRLKASQAFFEAVCKMKNIESLFVTTATATDLQCLSKFEKLTRLHLGSFTQLVDISPLKNLSKLSILSISNCFKVNNYHIIGEMENLVALGLYGDESSPKNLRLPSLKPYGNLRQLRHLDLSVTTVIDNSYEILLEMPNLERFDTLTTIKKDLREKIKTHAKLKAGFFMDWDWDKKCFYENRNW